MPLLKNQAPTLQARFGLGCYLPYLIRGQEIAGLSGMRALEVGGSLPRELVIDTLGATQ
jgi:hypothetical protein